MRSILGQVKILHLLVTYHLPLPTPGSLRVEFDCSLTEFDHVNSLCITINEENTNPTGSGTNATGQLNPAKSIDPMIMFTQIMKNMEAQGEADSKCFEKQTKAEADAREANQKQF
jgi:hypothetical protein